uniref:Uncharacterized protein n=1 Tax=Aplanochytrium stocchinoi TaxID=215587 RepID=A0A7S3PF45_9STRA
MAQVPALQPLFGPPGINLGFSDFLAMKTMTCIKWYNESIRFRRSRQSQVAGSSFANIALFRGRKKGNHLREPSVFDSWLDGDDDLSSPTLQSPSFTNHSSDRNMASPTFVSPMPDSPMPETPMPETSMPANPSARKVSDLGDDML